MKIDSIEITDYAPLKYLKINKLGSFVILAGANGSGKTRIKQAILQAFKGVSAINLKIQATREDERIAFKSEFIETQKNQHNPILHQYINSPNTEKGEYIGSLVQIDSQRNIQTTKYTPVTFQTFDPDEEVSQKNYYHHNFTVRWQNFMDYIHIKVAAYNGLIAEKMQNNPKLTGEEILKKYPHPFDKYKKIFTQLLPGKELQAIEPTKPSEFRYKDTSGSILPFHTLSSGEQEVIKITFDVVRKDIRHSVIIVDEPELHLHPTLTFKLVETLKTIGGSSNQLIFLTHSSDLISTYYSTGNVYFIDSVQTGENQAHKLSELNHSHKELLQLIGDNLGIISVGKTLIFAEGENSSIDRLTYHSIAQQYLSEAKIIPTGSVENIVALNAIEEQIRNSIFGINLYMIRDRDGLSTKQIELIEKNGRIKCLRKRHIENYFLDAEILYKVAERLCLTTIWPNLTEDSIKSELKRIATESLSYSLLQNIKEHLKQNITFKIPTVKSITSKNIEIIKTEMLAGIHLSTNELSTKLSPDTLEKWITTEAERLQLSLQKDEWKNEFHGKSIFSKLCSDVLREDHLKIRQAYTEIALKEKPEIFQDIIDIFSNFK